jgi:FtsP/CotA-like multicopper oxidase with cupredoxin domain
MNRRASALRMAVVAAACGFLGTACDSLNNRREPAAAGMRSTTQSQRWAARSSQAKQQVGVGVHFAGVNALTAQFSPLTNGLSALATMADAGARPDVFAVANYANSPLVQTYGSGASATATVDTTAGSPTQGQVITLALGLGGSAYSQTPSVTFIGGGGTGASATAVVDTNPASATYQQVAAVTLVSGGTGYTSAPLVQIIGQVVPGTGMRKFVDTLPGLCDLLGPNTGRNNLGQCLPIARPLSAAAAAAKGVPTDGGFAGDYYEIELGEYAQQLHSDLPPTRLRGYADLNNLGAGGARVHQYLGPVILATRDRPVRVKFVNNLPVGAPGELFIPVDRSYMGAGNGPDDTPYSENRGTLHLHGGNSPWISDGTPHQWTVPAGESRFTNFTKGLSSRDVPDMPATGDGTMTFYWTNQQSGRLMFYHDHAYGITRLNVYAGEAAGYVLIDPTQEDALGQASVPGTLAGANADLAHFLPLVVQDKTFVPDNGVAGGQLAATDPTWNVARWGGAGSLWFPHVYSPNQNPADLTGANAYGRWDYGPWFWPPQDPTTFAAEARPAVCGSAAYTGLTPAFPPLTCPGTPVVSGTPEGFMDTPLVNGTAYPSHTVEPGAYRFQLLNAANDRSWNFGLYYAATKDGVVCKGGAVTDLSACTEVVMVPAVPHQQACSATVATNCLCNATASPAGCTQPGPSALPACPVATAIGGGGLAVADTTGGAPINGTGLPAACWPSTWPTDGREGGVPDPTTAGPPLVQLGSEGGLLPNPAVIPSTPVGYEYNRRSITVLNVFSHGLLAGPAERSDLVVDFSSVPPGSALILYNDGAAPVPAFDPRVDYFTGSSDNTPTGGAPSTPPGYGPNTRTVMQFKVQGTSTNKVPFSLAALRAAQPALFAAVQDQVIMPGTAYPPANGGAASDTYVRIQDTSVSYFDHGAVGSLTLTSGGSGYTSAPAVLIAPPASCDGGCVQATASASISGSVSRVAVVPSSARYTAVPAVTFSGGGAGSGATAEAVLAPTTVASITLTPSNTVFTSAPTITLTPPAVGCQPATATVKLSGSGTVASITLTNPASTATCPRYTAEPLVTVSGGGATGVSAKATLAPTPVASVTVTSGGAGYTAAPAVAIAPPRAGQAPRATAVLGALSVTGLNVLTGGSGYTSAPVVTISGGGGSGATAIANGQLMPLQAKTIQELFTLDYGRMNATLGVELPFTNFLTQTTIPYGYVDPPTEIIKPGETQFWKITHNGVDTHYLHFHLFSVQLINRVGWDGAIKPPDANELGWKDTVRMNPLEDVVVALRPYAQTLPWKLPNSVRPLDVTRPVGSALPNQFTNVDPTNQGAVVTNELTNFGSEYVWHCHILGHEENDMMRAVSFVVNPDAPTKLAAQVSGRNVTLTWVDNAVNETGFTVQRAQLVGGVFGAYAPVGQVGQNVTTYRDRVGGPGTYAYQVIANNVVGYTTAYAAPAVGYPTVSGDSAPAGPVATIVK